jgi:ribosomal protein S12 methylthiotransferase accessory factor
MGITRVGNVTGLDCIGIPVVMVTRPNSRSVSVSQGKGIDLPAAKASGLMETVETYHAERIESPVILGSEREFRVRRNLIDVARLPRTEASLYHSDLQLAWIEGNDLVSDTSCWVPYEVVHTNYTYPPPPAAGCFSASSNGLASGNHILEAVSHGICEVVERDATTLWWARSATRHPCSRLELGTVDEPACQEVLERFRAAAVNVTVWPTTTDVGIPSFVCVIAERDHDPLRRLYTAMGMGCHPSRGVALLRALTEAAQARLTMISGARDDMFRNGYRSARHVDVLARQRADMTTPSDTVDFRNLPTHESDDFADDVNWELDGLRSVGISQVAVVDLTKPEFQIPVVRVVIPGLEGPIEKAPGYVPGPRARALLTAVAGNA